HAELRTGAGDECARLARGHLPDSDAARGRLARPRRQRFARARVARRGHDGTAGGLAPSVLHSRCGFARMRRRARRADARHATAPMRAVMQAGSGLLMRRSDAIAAVLSKISGEIVVTANGWIGREVCAASDREENFYMLGSMGLAGPIGLGLALTRPKRR